MKTVYIKDLKPNGVIEGETFAIIEVKSATDKNGNPYYDLVLGDKTGRAKAKIWSDVIPNIDKKQLKIGKLVAVDATLGEYKGQTQLTINLLSPVDETKLDDYLESSTFSTDDMFEDLKKIIKEKISDKHIKKMFENIFAEEELVRKLKYWPAAVSYHHDFRSGLLQHILECLMMAEGMDKYYPDVDFDLVRAGLILHDIGKTEEIDATGLVPRYTVTGSVLGHLYLGAEMVDRYLPKDAPDTLRLHLKHIILAHHGEKEKGSPVLPATTEALLVAGIDDTSSKARMGDKGVKEPSDEIGMTGYNRFLNRWMWAGNKPSEENS